MVNSDDPWYRGAARCHTCNYLYFPDFPDTWNSEAWLTDFQRKAETLLRQPYARLNDWRRDVYLVLQFVGCLDTMVTRYFSSPEFEEHERLLEILRSLGAAKSVDTLERVVRLAERPVQVLERFDPSEIRARMSTTRGKM